MFLLILFVVCVIAAYIIFCTYEALCSRIRIEVETAPLQKLTVAYKMSKRRVTCIGPLFNKFKVINICYTKRGNEDMVHSPMYAVGVIINEGDFDTGIERNLLVPFIGYKVFIIPASTLAVTASLRFSNYLSFQVALQRMYRHLDAHIHRHNLCAYPNVEIYDKSTVKVIIPLTRQTQYYVPEALAPPKWIWCLDYDGTNNEAIIQDDVSEYAEDSDDSETMDYNLKQKRYYEIQHRFRSYTPVRAITEKPRETQSSHHFIL